MPRHPGFLIVVLVALALALAAGPASAQQTPTLGQPSPQNTTPAQPVVTTTDTTGGGLKSWQQILIFGAGGVLLLGIGLAIVSDARERAGKVDGRPVAEPAGGGRHHHKQREKQRARAKAKAARAQRRRNR